MSAIGFEKQHHSYTYSDEVLPAERPNQSKSHNLLFTKLTDLLVQVEMLSKQEKQIKNEDLADYITQDMQIRNVIQKIEKYKEAHPNKYNDPCKFDLLAMYFHINGWNLIRGTLLCFGSSLVSCCGILCLDLITDLLKDYHGETDKKQQLCLFFFGIICIFVTQSFLSSQYQWAQSRWDGQARTMLQYLVFSKALKTYQLSVSYETSEVDKDQKEEDTAKQEAPDIHNIIGVDVDRQLMFFRGFTQLSMNLVQICIVLSLIYYKVGVAVFEGLKFLCILFIVNLGLTLTYLFIKKQQMKWNDKRVSLSKDVIEGMKSIKYLGWEYVFKKKIESLRSKEFLQVSLSQGINSIQNISWSSMNYILLYIFLSYYIDEGNELKKTNIFTVIALFGYLTEPFNMIPWACSYIAEARISFNRTQRFMNEPEIDASNNLNKDGTPDMTTTDQLHSNNNLNGIRSSEVIEQTAVYIKQMEFHWYNQQPNQIQNNQNEQQNQTQQDSNKFHLNIMNLQINKGELVVVVGKLGSGKTALLNAILNELNTQEKQLGDLTGKQQFNNRMSQKSQDENFFINGSIAYVSQNHWLTNKTVKENILFGEEFNADYYNSVIQAADLVSDLSGFAKGDEKLISSGARNLSGGQKQRIALCRALYSNKDIFLFDDILSSLDTHAADRIYQQAILELLIGKLKKTVIIVTSHFGVMFSKRRRSEISQIILLENGIINRDQVRINEFIRSGMTHELEEEKQKHRKESFNPNPKDMENKDDEVEDNNELEYSNSYAAKNEEKSSENKSEIRQKGEISSQTYRIYIEAMGWGILICFVCFNFFMQLTQMLVDFWLRDQIHPQEGFFYYINKIYHEFNPTFFMLISLTVSMSILKNIFYCLCALISDKRLFSKFNKCLIFSKMKFYDQTAAGRIVNRLSEDIFMLDEMLPYVCSFFLEYLAFSIGYPLGIVILFPYLIIFAIVAFGMIYMVQRIFRISNREIKRLNSVNAGKILTTIGETCNGVVLIRAFRKEKYVLTEFLEKLNSSINTAMLNSAIKVWMAVRLMLISNLIFGCVALASVGLILCDIKFDYSSIAMCLTYSILLTGNFIELMTQYCNVEQNIISVERISQYLGNEQENLEKSLLSQQQGYSNDLQQQAKNQEPSQYSLEFNDVYMTYDNIQEFQELTADSKEVEFALKGLTLKIKKGEKIAFCGRSGSGKTSVLNALFGMYPIQFGSIFVHGQNIVHYSLRELRQQMSIIPQFGFLYNDSLLRNLDPEGKVPRDIIQDKVNETNLHIRKKETSKIDQEKQANKDEESNGHNPESDFKNDLDLEINNGGSNISNGERQIINFLRVILRETDIICLDEASSNMDPKTDALLHEQIFKFAKDKTLLVITHRLESIDLFDRVIVMEKGNIVESGPVKELRKIKGGFFNKQQMHPQS